MRHLCEETSIEAYADEDVKSSIRVWRYREFAVGPDQGEWNIFFVPMGICLSAFTFSNLDRAIACMLEIDKLRNNWLGMEAEDWDAVRPKVIEIFNRYAPVIDGGFEGSHIRSETENGYGSLN